MIVAITGASGFVGRAVMSRLKKAGHSIRPVSLRTGLPADALAQCDAVVHLAGEPIAQRWTPAAKERIRSSRVEGTRAVINAMRAQRLQAAHRLQVMISASAVGYYGSRGDDVLTESEPPAADFLGTLAADWEKEALEAESLGVRVTRLRLGMVLGPDGGALARLLPPFRLGVGGRLGSGRQWMSWIHLHDLAALIEFLLKESTVRGAFNAVSPYPVTNAEFTGALAGALHRPAILPIPAAALKLVFGDMSQVLLASQRAIPDAATRAGFTFEYPDIFGALAEIVG
jgi:uncharacterized protein (TIGR01777 family)